MALTSCNHPHSHNDGDPGMFSRDLFAAESQITHYINKNKVPGIVCCVVKGDLFSIVRKLYSVADDL